LISHRSLQTQGLISHKAERKLIPASILSEGRLIARGLTLIASIMPRSYAWSDAAREQGFDMQPVAAKPLYIRMHADDNVAIVANRGGLHPGTKFACGLRLVEQIPQGHKVALADIGQGEIIRRYGEVIGHAAAPISRGSWVKESLVQRPDAPSFDNRQDDSTDRRNSCAHVQKSLRQRRGRARPARRARWNRCQDPARPAGTLRVRSHLRIATREMPR
jgi:hypothetical protein